MEREGDVLFTPQKKKVEDEKEGGHCGFGEASSKVSLFLQGHNSALITFCALALMQRRKNKSKTKIYIYFYLPCELLNSPVLRPECKIIQQKVIEKVTVLAFSLQITRCFRASEIAT